MIPTPSSAFSAPVNSLLPRQVALGCGLLLAAVSGLACAQPIITGDLAASIDRWNYPFASRPGLEEVVPVFAALFQPGFDDRDAQLLLGFNTSTLVPTGRELIRYIVNQVQVTVVVSNDNQFVYDNSFDSVATSYLTTDVGYLPDADLGKPIELFAVGYRNGQSAATFTETTPYSPFPPMPREGVRSAFPALFDGSENPTIDVSRNPRQRFEAPPLAVGQSSLLIPGQVVAAGTSFTFSISAFSAAEQRYFATAFSLGKLNLMVSSLHPASGGSGGGTGGSYPAFFTKENPLSPALGYAPRLTFDVTVYPGADFNEDGGVDGADVEAFILAWQASEPSADFNIDGGVDGTDVEAFFRAWEQG